MSKFFGRSAHNTELIESPNSDFALKSDFYFLCRCMLRIEPVGSAVDGLYDGLCLIYTIIVYFIESL